jgi:hypothetical protein
MTTSKSIQKRLDELEQQAKPVPGQVIIEHNLRGTGEWSRRGEPLSQAELEALEARYAAGEINLVRFMVVYE